MPQTKALQKLQLESTKNTIIDNLKVSHQSKFVNLGCAIRGLDANSITFAALKQLIQLKIVTVRQYSINGNFGEPLHLKLYRCVNF